MSTDITQKDQDTKLPTFGAGQFADDTTFDQLVRSAFLARVQLCGGSSDMVKEDKIRVGRFAYIQNKEDFVELGQEFQFFPLAYRFAAMKFATGAIEQYFNPESDDFKRIMVESEEKDSKCAYGPQFLIWVPQQKDFATFLFGSKSARPEGRKMKKLLDAGQAGVMKARLVSNQDNKWHVPVVVPYSGVIEPFDHDTAAALAAKFKNPGESSTEVEFKPTDQQGAAETGERPR